MEFKLGKMFAFLVPALRKKPSKAEAATQGQVVSAGSTAYQTAGNLTIIHQVGYTREDFKELAAEIRRSDMQQYAQVALSLAETRSETITEKIYDRIADQPTEKLARQASEPAFQHALYTAQKEFARTGDEDLGALLVELLAARAQEESRSFQQVVLDEALATSSKLTNDQIAALTLCFVFSRVRVGASSITRLAEIWDKLIPSLLKRIGTDKLKFDHLAYAGCGSVTLTHNPLATALSETYRSIFSMGIESDDARISELPNYLNHALLVPVSGNSGRVKINALNSEVLAETLTALNANLSPDVRATVESIFTSQGMSAVQIQELCVSTRPYMQHVFDLWRDSPIKSFQLTTVGVAIAHANLRMLLGEEIPGLETWIN